MFAFLPGLFTGLSLIIAIGAQNAFVIRQGLTRRYVFTVVAICTLIDASLIALGIGGLGAAIAGLPWLIEVIRWFGVAYLTWFGIKSIISATKNETMDASGVESKSAGKVIATVVAMSLLNPHVYLDTVIFVGGVGNTFGDNRWYFAYGAMLASALWFTSIGYGAKAMSRFMAKPIFWKVLDSVIAVIMFALAITLATFKF
ncbi:MAG: LysE/ArgO family amino acid transporter [Rhodoluna sp.]